MGPIRMLNVVFRETADKNDVIMRMLDVMSFREVNQHAKIPCYTKCECLD